MSELLKVSIERIEQSSSVIITVMDIKDDSENIRMIADDKKMFKKRSRSNLLYAGTPGGRLRRL